jgi:hypothetical protein
MVLTPAGIESSKQESNNCEPKPCLKSASTISNLSPSNNKSDCAIALFVDVPEAVKIL